TTTGSPTRAASGAQMSTWKITDDDGYAAFVREDKAIVCCVRTCTDEEKARARLIVFTPEALALAEMIANGEEGPDEWFAIARRIIWRMNSEQFRTDSTGG